MNDFIARVYPSRNRVPQGALERLERHAGKLARAVLRGLGGSNASRLLGEGTMATSSPYPTNGEGLESTSPLPYFIRERGRRKRASNGTSSASYSTADHALEVVEEADIWVGLL